MIPARIDLLRGVYIEIIASAESRGKLNNKVPSQAINPRITIDTDSPQRHQANKETPDMSEY